MGKVSCPFPPNKSPNRPAWTKRVGFSAAIPRTAKEFLNSVLRDIGSIRLGFSWPLAFPQNSEVDAPELCGPASLHFSLLSSQPWGLLHQISFTQRFGPNPFLPRKALGRNKFGSASSSPHPASPSPHPSQEPEAAPRGFLWLETKEPVSRPPTIKVGSPGGGARDFRADTLRMIRKFNLEADVIIKDFVDQEHWCAFTARRRCLHFPLSMKALAGRLWRGHGLWLSPGGLQCPQCSQGGGKGGPLEGSPGCGRMGRCPCADPYRPPSQRRIDLKGDGEGERLLLGKNRPSHPRGLSWWNTNSKCEGECGEIWEMSYYIFVPA